MSIPINVLIVEDSEDDAILLLREMRRGDYDPTFELVDTYEAMNAALDKNNWDIVIADYVMPRFSGLAALKLLKDKGFDIPFIIVSGKVGEEIAVEAMKAGAHDYIMKNNLVRLIPAIERELREAGFRRERKRSEELSKRYHLLCENARDIIFFFRPDGRIIEANNAAVSAYGYSKEKLLSMRIHDLRAQDTEASINEQIKQAETKGTLFETVHRRKDGSLFPVEVNSQGTMIDNEFVFLSIVRDIAERKKTEERIAECIKMVERSQRMASLGTMAAGITHEIYQPLNCLKMIVNRIFYWHKKGKTLDYGEIIEDLKSINVQSERISKIIKSIQAFVRSEHYSELAPCNLNTAIEEALSMIGSQISSHGIKLKKSLLGTLPPVFGNNCRLEEIVVNLVINAMQALDTVDKKDKEICIKTSVDKKNVMMEVSDNAIGVKDEIKNRIFEPFFTAKESGQGMGLGLSIVHTIVTSFNGRIYVKNNEKGGATFRVEFPVLIQLPDECGGLKREYSACRR